MFEHREFMLDSVRHMQSVDKINGGNIMKTVQCNEWLIEVDIDKTKQYYNTYKQKNNQANRNFAEYCKSLTAEEKSFFDAFGIKPTCCEIEHIGADKKGNFPCGGYYLVCGKYLKYPPEEFTTIEELAKNNFVDNRADPRVCIGIFEFDFQCEDYEINDIPEDMPQGFICIRFWCEDMKWLLPEKPEEMMYEPPRFWEIHKIIQETLTQKKGQKMLLEEAKAEFISFFDELNIEAEPLSKKEIKKYKEEWINRFSPLNSHKKEIKKHCLNSRKYTPYLWHIFSFEFLNCETEKNADVLFDRQNKADCIILSNVDNLAFKLNRAENLKAELIEQFCDVTITSEDFLWTYSKTHEETCGPYFYKK